MWWDGESLGLAEGESFLMISTSLDRLKGRLRDAGRPMEVEGTVEEGVPAEVVTMDGLPGLLLLLLLPTVLVKVVPKKKKKKL